ncbi:MAG: transporter ATP-binding protein [Acidimicrobiia bacterium]|nr:transporter ATP-binding protein [Acidimicrobiia bacterium]
MTNAIEVRNVSKTFRLLTNPVHSIKERVLTMGRNHFELFDALHEVSFDVEEGETVGILGHNGSGKSTLLKCIAGILSPTTGEVRLRGRIASLLELGAGFHPELSGRENVFINASFLGIPRKDVEARFDDIVAFAELEQFIDQQVKHYSSGMYVRLAFAVAVNVDPDILLVDEVLAVGDEVFQEKCLDRIKQFQKEGRTILFVTHSADLVRQLCTRAIVFDHGHMVGNGLPSESIRVFREHLYGFVEQGDDERTVDRERDPRIRITGVTFEHPGSPDRAHVRSGEPLTIRVGYEAKEDLPGTIMSLEIYNLKGEMLYGADSDDLNVNHGDLTGTGEMVFEIASVPFLDGKFPIAIHLKSRDEVRYLDWRDPDQQDFEVINPGKAVGIVHVPLQVHVNHLAGKRTQTLES